MMPLEQRSLKSEAAKLPPQRYPLVQDVPVLADPLGHYEVTLLNCHGAILSAPRIYTMDCRSRELEKLSVVTRLKGRQVEIAVEENNSPHIAVRNSLFHNDPLPSSWPYRVLASTKEPPLTDAALGGNFFPSVGGTTEWCQLLHSPAMLTDTSSVSYLPAQKIIHDYCSGVTQDLRLLLAAFRVARFNGEKPTLPCTMTNRTLSNCGSGGIPVLSKSDVGTWMESMPSEDRVAYVRMRSARCPDAPFLTAKSFVVRASELSKTQEVTLMLRKGLDAVDVAAYTFIDRRPHLLIKREIRPALAVPTLLSGGEGTLMRATSLGGVAESLEGEQTIAAIKDRGSQGVREETGLEPVAEPVFLGFSYTSPSRGLERAYHVAIEVNPYRESGLEPELDEVVDLAYVAAEDVVDLANQGIIQDPRLELSAHFVLAAFSGKAPVLE